MLMSVTNLSKDQYISPLLLSTVTGWSVPPHTVQNFKPWDSDIILNKITYRPPHIQAITLVQDFPAANI